ncbi:unnamed protein product [Orchesella dallaii]|uniref:Odorant receptor n=1 Tax=Orchesella dallaii TaxID=48710 RepID=A0ABP1S6S9_9HEXA
MISSNFLRIVKWRMALMKFSQFTYISWDSETNRMILSEYHYGIFSSFSFTFYLYTMGPFSLYHAFGYIFAEPENGTDDIFDVDFQPRDEASSILSGLAHITYAFACTLLMGNLEILLITRRREFLEFINMTIQNDLRYQEIYKESLNRLPNIKRYHKESDALLLLIAVGTVVVPFIFGWVIFQEFCPEHQILLRYFEIKVKLEWKYVPMLVYAIYMALQACDILFIIDIGALLYLNSCLVWLQFIHPDAVEIEEETPKFRCHIGCTLNEFEVLRVYKEQEILQEGFNAMFANRLVTGHHSSFLYISTCCLFICIRHWRFIHQPRFLMAPLGAICCTFAEYVEGRFAENVTDTSGEYLHSLGVLANREPRRLRTLRKCLKSHRPLQPQLAYPYYKLTRENYLLFVNSIVNNLVSFLVSYQ